MNSVDGLIDVIRSYKSSHMLATAINLGVLNAFGSKTKTILEIAEYCSLSANYTRIFLAILTNFNLVDRSGIDFQLTSLGQEASTDEILRAFSQYHMYAFEAWRELFSCSRSDNNGGKFHKRKMSDPDFCQAYLEAMETLTKTNLSFLVEKCQHVLHGRVLDIGAGPATLSRYLVKTNGLAVTAIDYEPIVAKAKKLFNYPENFNWEANDFRKIKTEGYYDGTYCSHVLEYCSLDNLPLWLGKIKTLLKPGGAAVFLVFLRANKEDENLPLDLFEISTGLNGESLGHICTEAEFHSALSEEGFIDITSTPLPSKASYSEFLVICRKRLEK